MLPRLRPLTLLLLLGAWAGLPLAGNGGPSEAAPGLAVRLAGVVGPPAALAQEPDSDEAPDAERPAEGREAIPNAATFTEPPLPAPNAYRTGAGRPGPAYWQQRVDYRIQARLDPAAHRVEGSQTLLYTNNSPDTLRLLWLQLDQNLFDPQSRGARLAGPEDRFGGAFPGGGFDIARVRVAEEGAETSVEPLIEGTTMRVSLPQPLAPGGRLELRLDFGFTIPELGADRMGRMDASQGTVYQIAQWYPRPFVYDDVGGWNVLPYLGRGEWYLEYGDFEVELTVPREYLVLATGRLQNATDVLTAEQRARLERAAGSREPVDIVSAEEVGRPETRPGGEGPLTWRFTAEDVRDFAWAASPAFIWDAAGWEGVLAMSAYPREGLGAAGRTGWESSTRYVLHSLRHYSETWHPYPYPVAINVAGPVTGMEYPMIAFCTVQARGRGLFLVTDHEIAHMWFPMLVGSDERRHFWMDEGLDSFMNHYSARAFYSDEVQPLPVLADQMARAMASPLGAQPVATQADRIRVPALGFTSYEKPGYALLLLREHVLGPARFDAAFREYIRRWTLKHPQPADFFRTIEDVAGEDLSWFWQGWWFGTGTLDQAIAGVQARDDTVRVSVESRGALVMPVDVRVVFQDGASETRRVPVEAWHAADRFELRIPAEGRAVRAVQLDPEGRLPDVDRRNNVWGRGVVGR